MDNYTRFMRFTLIDRIHEVAKGQQLKATKNLTLGEEYLADHFPTFPVMPGVLMLEALVQAAAWLIRITEDFHPTIITLKEVKGVKYGNFMEPGKQLNLAVEVQGSYNKELTTVSFKGTGEANGQSTVNARFVLQKRRLQDSRPELATMDDNVRRIYREQYALINRSEPSKV